MKTYFFGLDGTLCTTAHHGNFENAKPIEKHIDYVNYLKSQGHFIVIWSNRDEISGQTETMKTYNQLQKWNIQYNKLILYKPAFDVLYDENVYNKTEIINHHRLHTGARFRDRKTENLKSRFFSNCMIVAICLAPVFVAITPAVVLARFTNAVAAAIFVWNK